MIVAIADDFTGAAEIAGITWRHGLNTEIQTKFHINHVPDVLIIDTNTRSGNVRDAEEIMTQIARELVTVRFDCIYKKIDSVLRGHAIRELDILIKELGFTGALLVPANPSAKRTIKNGNYYIDDIPLSETDFADDPEYPRAESDIRSLIGMIEERDVHILEVGKRLDQRAIQIGECQSAKDLDTWASQLTGAIIPAGASEFFCHILEQKKYHTRQSLTQETFQHQFPLLIVVGSTSKRSQLYLEQFRKMGLPICKPPEKINDTRLSEQELILEWTEQISSTFMNYRTVIISTGEMLAEDFNLSHSLISILGSLIKKIYSKVKFRELVIEGGATASSIIRCLGWHHLIPIYEFGQGVVALQISESPVSQLVVKPGSYNWPVCFYKGINYQENNGNHDCNDTKYNEINKGRLQ